MQQKKAFRCGSCNWKFRRVAEPKLCPNCGKKAVAPDSLQGADEILKELDDMTSQFDRQ